MCIFPARMPAAASSPCQVLSMWLLRAPNRRSARKASRPPAEPLIVGMARRTPPGTPLGRLYVPPRPSRPPHREAKVETRSAGSADPTIAPAEQYAFSSTPYIDFDRKSNRIKDLLDNSLALL